MTLPHRSVSLRKAPRNSSAAANEGVTPDRAPVPRRAAVVERQITIHDMGNEIGAPHRKAAHRIRLNVVRCLVEVVSAAEAVAKFLWAVKNRIHVVEQV